MSERLERREAKSLDTLIDTVIAEARRLGILRIGAAIESDECLGNDLPSSVVRLTERG